MPHEPRGEEDTFSPFLLIDCCHTQGRQVAPGLPRRGVPAQRARLRHVLRHARRRREPLAPLVDLRRRRRRLRRDDVQRFVDHEQQPRRSAGATDVVGGRRARERLRLLPALLGRAARRAGRGGRARARHRRRQWGAAVPLPGVHDGALSEPGPDHTTSIHTHTQVQRSSTSKIRTRSANKPTPRLSLSLSLRRRRFPSASMTSTRARRALRAACGQMATSGRTRPARASPARGPRATTVLATGSSSRRWSPRWTRRSRTSRARSTLAACATTRCARVFARADGDGGGGARPFPPPSLVVLRRRRRRLATVPTTVLVVLRARPILRATRCRRHS